MARERLPFRAFPARTRERQQLQVLFDSLAHSPLLIIPVCLADQGGPHDQCLHADHWGLNMIVESVKMSDIKMSEKT